MATLQCRETWRKEAERESLRAKIEIIRGKQNVLTPKACVLFYSDCLCACVCRQYAWNMAMFLLIACFYLPSVPLFPGQGGTSLSPQLWGNLWGSQTAWQCQSPGMSWQPRTWGPVQRTPAWAAWRRHRSLGHFSIQQEARISCLT